MSALLSIVTALLFANSCFGLNQEVVDFVTDNGRKFVNIVTNETGRAQTDIGTDLLKNHSIPAQFLTFEHFDGRYFFATDFNIIAFDWNEDDLPTLASLITKTKIKSTLLYIPTAVSATEIDLLKEALSSQQSNSLFYLCYPDSMDMMKWHYVMTINHQLHVVLGDLNFFEDTKMIQESYDLQGMAVISTSMDWTPYLQFDSCEDTLGQNCVTSGFLMDLVTVLARRYNFTITSTRDPDLNWGLSPISGPFNLSGEWGGVMGDVVTGKYQMSLSQWYYIRERNDILDFVSTTSDQEMLALTPQPTAVDIGLFIRPFTDEAWTAIHVMNLVILCSLMIPYFSVKYFENTSGYMIASISAWYFFVLLNAFYGGALTMFFTSEMTIPFESIQDVMRAYPDWNLLMLDGMYSHI